MHQSAYAESEWKTFSKLRGRRRSFIVCVFFISSISPFPGIQRHRSIISCIISAGHSKGSKEESLLEFRAVANECAHYIALCTTQARQAANCNLYWFQITMKIIIKGMEYHKHFYLRPDPLLSSCTCPITDNVNVIIIIRSDMCARPATY